MAAGPTPSRVAAIDEWRAVAALLVVFCHSGVNLPLPGFRIWGFSGVHLFFVLSGYLIFTPFVRSILRGEPAPSTREFYLRRVARIFPAYLVALLAYAVARFASGLHPPTSENLVAHTLLLFNYLDASHFFSIGAVFWSLAIEMQFYWLLPGIAWIARRHLPAVLFGLIAIGLLSRAIEFKYFPPDLSLAAPVRFRWISSYIDLFAFGMGVAWVRERGWTRPVWAGASGLGLFLAAQGWCSLTGRGSWLTVDQLAYTVFFPVVLCAGCALLLWSILGRSRPRTALARIGEMSYSLYLYHVLAQLALGRIVTFKWIGHGFWENVAFGLVSLPVTLLISWVMYRWVELPSLRWLERRKTTTTLVVAAA